MQKVLVLIAMGLVCAVVPAGASGAVTFGADLSHSPVNSSGSNTVTNVIAPGGAPDLGAPVTGTLTSVRIRTTGAGGIGEIRVLTQASHPNPTTYGFLNTAPEIPVQVASDLTPAGHITEVVVSRPITAGDRLAWFINDPARGIFSSYNDPTAECAFLIADPPTHMTGTTKDYTTSDCNHNVVLLSATIEPAPGPTGQRAAALKKCKKKHGKKTRKKCRKKAKRLPV
jgi:hypothetical protein